MPSTGSTKFIPRAALALGSVGVVALLLMPYSGLQAIRSNVEWVGSLSAWFDTLAPGLDMEHLVVFTMLGALSRFAQRRPRWLVTGLLLCLFGLATELAQGWISSRSPRVDDLLLNFAGAALGYAVAAAMAAAFRAKPPA